MWSHWLLTLDPSKHCTTTPRSHAEGGHVRLRQLLLPRVQVVARAISRGEQALLDRVPRKSQVYASSRKTQRPASPVGEKCFSIVSIQFKADLVSIFSPFLAFSILFHAFSPGRSPLEMQRSHAHCLVTFATAPPVATAPRPKKAKQSRLDSAHLRQTPSTGRKARTISEIFRI